MEESLDSIHARPLSGGILNDTPLATFEKMENLLKAKDDTSRFVGLALLKTVLDNGQLIQDSERIRILWEALSPKFLDRLLRAHQNTKISKSQAQDMVDLAVTVLHTFSIIIPEESRKEKAFVGRAPALVKALVESPPETTKLMLQTLLTLSSQPEGALELLKIEDLSPLTEIAVQYPEVLDILNFTWVNASIISSEADAVQKSINKTIPILLTVFSGTDAVTLLNLVGSLLPRLTPEALPKDPKWLAPLVMFLRKLFVSKPTLAGRNAYTHLAAALLQLYPTVTPQLLFKDGALQDPDSKPFSYLFITLLIIDIRSSFPSLLAQINNDDYPKISQRLSAAFDIISSFTGFLIRSLSENTPSFSMPPDLLLKIRKDLAETMSLAIEYLRDRWDASIAGAAGLHPSARTGTAATSEGTRLTLTWESIKDDVRTDPLILAAIRTLTIWIREDENDNLRNETSGLMDMFIELYKTSSKDALDFRYPILLALEGIMVADEGTDKFLEQDGWQVLYQDLEGILKLGINDDTAGPVAKRSEAERGVQIIRVLLAVLDNPSTSSPREDWMAVVTLAASMKPPVNAPSIILEFQIAMLQLSAALLSMAAGGMQKRYVTSIAAISGLTRQLEIIVKSLRDKAEASEFLELLSDVTLELENLRSYG